MSTFEQEIITCRDGEGQIILDLRYFPLVIVPWIGTPTPALVKQYYDARRPITTHAARLGVKIIVVSELGQAKAPPATVRKSMAELANEDVSNEGLLEYITVVPNAVLRGVVTALSWIVGDQGKPNMYSSTMEDALRIAATKFQRAGIAAPDFPRPYVPA